MIDSADDVQAAEEHINLLNAKIAELGGKPEPFCRPSCLENVEYVDDEGLTACDDEGCGCFCHDLEDGCDHCGQIGFQAPDEPPGRDAPHADLMGGRE